MALISIFGAGKSSSYAIKYLLEAASKHNWFLHVCDQNTSHLQQRFEGNDHLVLHNLDITNAEERHAQVEKSAIVISLMPPHLHFLLAQDCVALGKHLITASYVSEEIKGLHDTAVTNNVMLMCELGLDPGIDHMSAMQIIHELHEQGAIITEFYSHCGGLVSPESDTNKWHYKISWNPRNVVTAGAAGAKFIKNGVEVNVPYEKMFAAVPQLQVEGLPTLAYYANRDSVSYKDDYELKDIHTLVRTTLRYPDFISAWHYLVQYGFTSTTDVIAEGASYATWFASKLNKPWAEVVHNAAHAQMLEELNLNSTILIPSTCKCSADVLQQIIETQWAMQAHDKDMIVMCHEFKYKLNGSDHYKKSSLVVHGTDKVYTAMAKTVGLPMAIFAEQILLGNIQAIAGVHIPTMPALYNPLLKELSLQEINFTEYDETIS
jgi:saccharopine dehydrogenase-like NADP-dependent oxidoreductase